MTLPIFFSDQHALHDPQCFVIRGEPATYPDSPERVRHFLDNLRSAGYQWQAPSSHGMAPLAAVHSLDYLNFLETGHAQWTALEGASPEIIPHSFPGRRMSERPDHINGLAGYYMAGTSGVIAAGTWQAARASADVALDAADAVLAGADVAYGLCRPPGHHAYSDLAGGFCYLNNVAVAAQYMRRTLPRVAILDVDVHHGNGTQGIFYNRADVLFVSLHGDPAGFYPYYAGYGHERGHGAGEGFNLNLPLPSGTGDATYLSTLAKGLAAIERFAPDALLISLGLDAQENDPLGILSITTVGFAEIAGAIAKLHLPTVIIQEGGYLCPELGPNLVSFLTGFEHNGN